MENDADIDKVGGLSSSSFSVFVIIITSILTLLITGYIIIYTKHKKLEKEISIKTRGIPVKDFSLITPILGELPLFLDYMVYQDENHPKYGNIFATLALNDVYIVINGPDLFDQVYYEKSKHLKHDYVESFGEMFGKDSIGVSEGEQHKRFRKIIFSCVGIPSLIRLFPGFVQVFDRNIKSWIEETKDGSYIDIVPKVQMAIMEAMVLVVLGDDISSDVIEELNIVINEFSLGVVATPINLPFTTFGKALAAKRRFQDILRKEYKRRQEMPDRGVNRKDFFQTVINETCNDGLKDGYNMDLAVGVIWASIDTTKSSTLSMIDTMIDHFKEWDHLRNELQNAFGSEGIAAPDVTFSRLEKEVPYLSACVKETMRYCGVGLFGVRKVISDFELQSEGKTYLIPAGYKVYSSFYYNGKDPESKVFSDSSSFIPERFLGEEAQDKLSGFKTATTNFSAGDRICPGSPIAKLEMEIIMALMSNYKWTRKERVKAWKSTPFPIPEKGLFIRGIPIPKKN